MNKNKSRINLNLGKAGAVMYACDLTEDYVDFNKGDVDDVVSGRRK
jgi:N-acetylglutamate synthase/N-acetylornithine aminotransferase